MDKKLNIFVTGASSGIGRAVAIELARRGHRVFAAARRRAVLKELAASQPGITAVALDVTDEESIAWAWGSIEEATGGAGVDVLVNAAGFALTGPVETLSTPQVKRQFDTNVFGLLAVTRAVLPAMRRRGSGRIVNISSIVGRVSFPAMGVYAATKYALEAVSDALRMEVAGLGIQVVLIEPGFVATDIVDASGRERAHGDGQHGPAADAGFAHYDPLIEGANRFLDKQMKTALAADKLARVIADAVETRKPRARYVTPASVRGLVAVLTRLPDRLADAAKNRVLNGSA